MGVLMQKGGRIVIGDDIANGFLCTNCIHRNKHNGEGCQRYNAEIVLINAMFGSCCYRADKEENKPIVRGRDVQWPHLEIDFSMPNACYLNNGHVCHGIKVVDEPGPQRFYCRFIEASPETVFKDIIALMRMTSRPKWCPVVEVPAEQLMNDKHE